MIEKPRCTYDKEHWHHYTLYLPGTHPRIMYTPPTKIPEGGKLEWVTVNSMGWCVERTEVKDEELAEHKRYASDHLPEEPR